MRKQIWCQSCGKWYESEICISECPYCYTFNYAGIEENSNGE
ncbi:MAG: hypothetical protein ACTSXT_08175 [Candidatus Helarchaeota archaeon]